MATDVGNSASVTALQSQTSRLLEQAEAGASSKQDAKIDKAGRDFESILLTSWLEKAEASFGSVPGGDEDDAEDPGKGQLQSIATQALGSAMAASGGIGIARMITEHLKASAASVPGTQRHAGLPHRRETEGNG
jgi:Rod binding domain-containing protein